MNDEYIYYKACPICSERHAYLLRQVDCTGHDRWVEPLSDNLVWLKCNSCGHEFRHGYYSSSSWELLNTTPRSQHVGINFHSDRIVSSGMIERVKKFQQTGHWLDVGFGNGALLMTAHEYGYQVTGIEVNKHNVDALKFLGINVIQGNFEQMVLDQQFDIVSLCDVLEHTQYPLDALDKVKKILKPGGILLISMPNRDSLAWKIQDLEGDISYWHELTHFHNFGRDLLYKILSDRNFEIVEYGISKRYKSCMEVLAQNKT